MVGIVAIIVVAKNRIHVPEPLAKVHATNGALLWFAITSGPGSQSGPPRPAPPLPRPAIAARMPANAFPVHSAAASISLPLRARAAPTLAAGALPYIMPLDSTSVDYLYVNLLIGPYYDKGANGTGGGGGHRRRLAAWVGEALRVRDGGAGDLPPGTPHLVAAEATSELVWGVRKLLSKPKLTLARRGRQARRLLIEEGVEEPANDDSSGVDLPQLKVRGGAWLW